MFMLFHKLCEKNDSEVFGNRIEEFEYQIGAHYGKIKDHEKCLFHLKKYENYILSNFGTIPDIFNYFKLQNMYHMMFVTYVSLGDMKSAKKCFSKFPPATGLCLCVWGGSTKEQSV